VDDTGTRATVFIYVYEFELEVFVNGLIRFHGEKTPERQFPRAKNPGVSTNKVRMRYHFLLSLLGLLLDREFFTLLPITQEVRIQRILDGDTLELRGGERLRLSGVDAPELGQPMAQGAGDAGEMARRCLKRLVAHKRWRLRPQGRDIYGRQLGELLCGGESLNFMLVAQGCASVYAAETTPVLWRAREQARRRRLGLWAQGGFMRPSQWRRLGKK
jgi:endonuclease YncB( thermonuclease family)